MPAPSDILYGRLAWLKVGASANLAAETQMWGGAPQSLPTGSITALSDTNQKVGGPNIPATVLSLVFYTTPTILTLLRGTISTGANAGEYHGILGTEQDVEIQYLEELGTGTPGDASTTAPVGKFEKCYIDGPGQFPGGDWSSPMLVTCNWTVNGRAYWDTQ